MSERYSVIDVAEHEAADRIIRRRWPGLHLCAIPTCYVIVPIERPRCYFHAKRVQ